jgi:hypothetical protein
MKKLTLPVSLFFFLTLSVSNTHACSCGDISQREAYRKSHAIFIGQFVEYGETPKNKDAPFPIKFKVEKMWKGKRQAEIVIHTYDLARSVCSEGFIPGKKYLVYAYGDKLLANLTCSPSHLFITDSGYADYKIQEKEIRNLNSFWFRFFARILPFG